MSHAHLAWSAAKAIAKTARPEPASLTIVNYTDHDANIAICPGYFDAEFSEGWFMVKGKSSFKIELNIIPRSPLPVLVYATSDAGEWTGSAGFWVLEGSSFKIQSAVHPRNFEIVEGGGRPNLVDGKRLEVAGDATYNLR